MLNQKSVYRALGLSLGTGILIGTVWLRQVSVAAQSEPDDSAANARTQITGTWFGYGFLPVPGSLPLASFQQFHSDGTLSYMDESDYGGAPFPRKNGPGFGTWSRLGLHTYRIKLMFMDFDNSTNVITAISVFQAIAEIKAGDFDHMTVTGSYVDYACMPASAFPFVSCPDPLSPDATPSTPPTPVTITYKRMPPR